MKTQTKEEAIAELAEAHFSMDTGLKAIYRLIGNDEEDPSEPIKLLEVNEDTLPAGIVPVYFGSLPHKRIQYPYVIVEITPVEFQQLVKGEISLPYGWTHGPLYQHSRTLETAA
jgi:hypothetical protein